MAPERPPGTPYRPLDLPVVVVQGLRLEYLDLPASRPGGPVLVLLHEGLGCVAMWRDFPQRLAAATGCRVVAWSRAGYGGSDPSDTPRRPDYLEVEARQGLPATLAALGLERPVLVGHSDGATLALLFAGSFPGSVAGVVAMSPHEFVEPETLAGLRQALQAWETTDWPERLGRYHRDVERVFREWNDTWLAPGFQEWNIEGTLSGIRCPVLALQGEDDSYATMRQIDAIAERVEATTLLKLPGCGHSPHLECPAAVLEALAGFLARVR